MYGPGTAAASADAERFESGSAPEPGGVGVGPAMVAAGMSDQPQPCAGLGRPDGIRASGVTATIVPVPHNPDLPCTDDPELFFAESPEDVETAKALCGGCAARAVCLEGALERREPWGVWGGELFLRGGIVPRKRPRGRPRKTEVAA